MFGTGEPRLRPVDPAILRATAPVRGAISADRLRADVEALAIPRGRLHAPEAMAHAESHVLESLRAAGWQADSFPFSLQNVAGSLDRRPYGPTVYPELRGVNLVAVKPGEQSSDALLVGAHLDSVPNSPGADDNAAGVAALLELARVLAPRRFRQTLLLAAFDMEEIGLIGARTLVPAIQRERRLLGAVIFESMAYSSSASGSQSVPPGMDLLYRGQIARLRRRQFAGDFTALIYNRRSRSLARGFGEALAVTAGSDAPLLLRDPNDLSVLGRVIRRAVPAIRNFGRSDHAVCWQAGIPAVLVTDTADFRNPAYHRPADTPDTLDYPRLAAIVAATVIALATTAGVLS